ncbi:MAG: hypothetical protein FWG26_08405 [Betaproteobacteria bacterium]|jgi:hypothetical protein|nr:hypothetical protein [Betaproteobacteria bacterium]
MMKFRKQGSDQTSEADGTGALPLHEIDDGKKITKKQLLEAIDSLKKNPNDRIRILGDVGITGVGMGVGAMAAGSVAAMAGATKVTIVTGLAAKLGITAVAATPSGWVVGTAAAGSALFYGVSRLIRSGAMSEGRKRELLEKFNEQIREIKAKENIISITSSDRNRFIVSLREVIEKNLLLPEKAFRLIEAVENGNMPISSACKLVQGVLQAE